MNTRLRIAISVVLVLAFWHSLTLFKIVSPLLVPSPASVAVALVDIIFSAKGLTVVGVTLIRSVAGLAIGTCLGALLGICFGVLPKVKEIGLPWTDAFRSVPAPAFIPLLLLLLGTGESSRVVLIVCMVAPLITVTIANAITNCSPVRLLAGKSLGYTQTQIIKKIIIPEILPPASSGFKLAISFAFIIAIIGEMFIGTKYGIGRAMLDAQLVYETATMYAYIVVSGLMGFGLNWMYAKIEAHCIHWSGK